MKIFAFAGSTSSTSINRALVDCTLSHFKNDDINLVSLRTFDMPIFCADLEKAEGHPEAAHQFLKNIADCDVIICSLAEHNRSYSAAFKNVLDWASRINNKVFQNKPMLLMTTSPGGYGGGNVMKEATTFFPQFGADIRATFSLPKFAENFDANVGIMNEALATQHLEAIATFKASLS